MISLNTLLKEELEQMVQPNQEGILDEGFFDRIMASLGLFLGLVTIGGVSVAKRIQKLRKAQKKLDPELKKALKNMKPEEQKKLLQTLQKQGAAEETKIEIPGNVKDEATPEQVKQIEQVATETVITQAIMDNPEDFEVEGNKVVAAPGAGHSSKGEPADKSKGKTDSKREPKKGDVLNSGFNKYKITGFTGHGDIQWTKFYDGSTGVWSRTLFDQFIELKRIEYDDEKTTSSSKPDDSPATKSGSTQKTSKSDDSSSAKSGDTLKKSTPTVTSPSANKNTGTTKGNTTTVVKPKPQQKEPAKPDTHTQQPYNGGSRQTRKTDTTTITSPAAKVHTLKPVITMRNGKPHYKMKNGKPLVKLREDSLIDLLKDIVHTAK